MQLQTARQELSHSLYQHDAACRVIARLNKEVAAAREALATLKPQAKTNGQVAMDVEAAVPMPIRLPEDVCEKLQAKAAVLTEERRSRGRTVPKELTTADQIRDFRLLQSHNVSTFIFDGCMRDLAGSDSLFFIRFPLIIGYSFG